MMLFLQLYSIRQNFRVGKLAIFQPIVKVSPLNHLLCTLHDGHGLMHRERFPVDSEFCAQPRKFSHSKVLLYTISLHKCDVIVLTQEITAWKLLLHENIKSWLY